MKFVPLRSPRAYLFRISHEPSNHPPTTAGANFTLPLNLSCAIFSAMSSLIIKSFPESLHARLKQTAAVHRRSVTQETIRLLEKALTKFLSLPVQSKCFAVPFTVAPNSCPPAIARSARARPRWSNSEPCPPKRTPTTRQAHTSGWLSPNPCWNAWKAS